MRVDPANHFSHNIAEKRPQQTQNAENRGDQLGARFARLQHSAGLMPGAESSGERGTGASFAARPEIEAGTLVSAG